MVKRWQRYGKLIVKVPWACGRKVHRIDLSINNLLVRWEKSLVHIKVELERKIWYVTAADVLVTTVDRVFYQKELPISANLIRGQPLAAEASSLYLMLQDRGVAPYLEQGIGLTFSGWEHQPKTGALPSADHSVLILGRQVVAENRHLHTQTLCWSEISGETTSIEATLTGRAFFLTAEGIHFRGELKLQQGEARKTLPLSVLLPQKVPANAELEGEATLKSLKILGDDKAFLIVQLDWRLMQEKPLPVLVAPPGEGEPFFLWRLLERKTRVWVGTTGVKLPEKAKFIEEVAVAEIKSTVVHERKGLLCRGYLVLDLFYINHEHLEKCYRWRLPWEEWVATPSQGELPSAAEEKREYKIGVTAAKVKQVRLLNGEELTLLLELEYVLTEGQREKVGLPVPAVGGKTTKIFAEKLMIEEPIEYYVEIPVAKPSDFVASDGLWWRQGTINGEAESGGVILKAEPTIVWQYRNGEHQSKVVEVKPALAWWHSAPATLREHQVLVETEALRLQLQPTASDDYRIQLFITGWLTVTAGTRRQVTTVGSPPPLVAPVLAAPKRSVLKWEEKLPCAAQQIVSAHFFLGLFRQVKTADLFLLEGEVRGELTYRGKDGVLRYHALKKELWADLPPLYRKAPVLIPVLTGWNCDPIPEWQWERGGVWCEVTVDLLVFSTELNDLEGGE